MDPDHRSLQAWDPEGGNLVFLVSQPRAGSTLVQRMLASHPGIVSAGEPWLMLHPIYAMRDTGIVTEYDAHLAHRAFATYAEALPAGRDVYVDAVRQYAGHLYAAAMVGREQGLFLDKTPRYYFILPELRRVFPRSKTVILLRNPLAVLASIVNTWVRATGSWATLEHYRGDLLVAPRLLAASLRTGDNAMLAVSYEDVVAHPSRSLAKVCGFLGLEHDPDLVERGLSATYIWEFGDTKREKVVHAGRAQAWQTLAEDPRIWSLMDTYLDQLDPSVVSDIGYSHRNLRRQLESLRPKRVGMRDRLRARYLLLGTDTRMRSNLDRLFRFLPGLRRDFMVTGGSHHD